MAREHQKTPVGKRAESKAWAKARGLARPTARATTKAGPLFARPGSLSSIADMFASTASRDRFGRWETS